MPKLPRRPPEERVHETHARHVTTHVFYICRTASRSQLPQQTTTAKGRNESYIKDQILQSNDETHQPYTFGFAVVEKVLNHDRDRSQQRWESKFPRLSMFAAV